MDWKPIRAEYIAGGTSYRKLAKKYNIPVTNIYRIAKNEQWVQLRKQADSEADAKTIEAIGKKSAKNTELLIDVANKLLKKLNETIEKVDVIDSQSLKHYTSALKDLKDIKGVKSDIDLREQEARIAKLEKEAMGDVAKDTTVIVQIEGDAEKWSK